MKKLAMGAFLVVALFPPCDREVPHYALTDLARKDMKLVVQNAGFIPIWEVGGRVKIRWPQLGLQLGVVAVGAWLVSSRQTPV